MAKKSGGGGHRIGLNFFTAFCVENCPRRYGLRWGSVHRDQERTDFDYVFLELSCAFVFVCRSSDYVWHTFIDSFGWLLNRYVDPVWTVQIIIKKKIECTCYSPKPRCAAPSPLAYAWGGRRPYTGTIMGRIYADRKDILPECERKKRAWISSGCAHVPYIHNKAVAGFALCCKDQEGKQWQTWPAGSQAVKNQSSDVESS